MKDIIYIFCYFIGCLVIVLAMSWMLVLGTTKILEDKCPKGLAHCLGKTYSGVKKDFEKGME